MPRLTPTSLTPTSLTGRLVATTVALVAVVSLLVAAVTAVAMSRYLTGQLDENVRGAMGRAAGEYEHGLPQRPPGDDHDDNPVRVPEGQGPGTLTAWFTPTGGSAKVRTSSGGLKPLSQEQLKAIARLPVDGRIHTAELPGLGGYRLMLVNNGTAVLVAGLPTRDVHDAVTTLVGWELLLALAGVTVAGAVGLVLVRRQLKPLRDVAATAHEVAEMPLDTGEIGMTVRVPEDLTDPRTEVGQVGAALNTMLVHVEEALDARHRSEQQVRQFVADASHELRTPLSTIHGYAQLSRRTTDADQLARSMGKVEAEATRMSSLVEDLLLLARLDAGRPLERREVDVTRLALETVADARVVGPEHRWALDLPEEPLYVVGDEQRLHQVVTNLLNNARRHTPPGTRVTLASRLEPTRAGGHSVVLTVHDDGPGIPAKLVNTIFERFARGDSSRTRASGGAGLGLSLVKAIAEAHGGSVSVSSKPGDTTFTVRLPAAETLAAEPTPSFTG